MDSGDIMSVVGDQRPIPKSHYGDPRRENTKTRGRGNKGWQIVEMWDRHHEIARRLVLGESNKDIAEDMNLSPATISAVKNSPVVQDKLALLHAARDSTTVDLAREIAEMAPLALQRVKEALSTGMVFGKEVSVANILKEANNILDRDMGKAIQRVDTRNMNATLTMSDLEEIKKKAASMGGRTA